jgi:hypothetical protein
MTGSMQILQAAQGGFTKPAVVVSQVSVTVAASPNIVFLPDGSLTVAGNGSSANPASWWVPTTTGIGAQFWIRLTVTGSAPDSGLNTVLSLASGASYGWTQSAVGSKTGTATVTFYSDAAGTQAVNSWSFNYTAQRTS